MAAVDEPTTATPAQTVVDALHSVSDPRASCSSINLAEAVPGVMAPLCASAWVPASELGLRSPFHAMGALASARQTIPPDPLDRITNVSTGEWRCASTSCARWAI